LCLAAGKYRFERNGESSTLVLNPVHTFRQTRRLGNIQQHSEGTWRRIGEGGIAFSKAFLMVSGGEPAPDRTTYRDMHKTLGLFVSLRLRPNYVLWYGKTGSGDSLPGTWDEPRVAATLVLNADHSFTQDIVQSDNAHHATGSWNQAPMERFGSREHSSRPPGNRSGMMKLHPQLTQEGRTFKLRSLWPTMSPNLCSLNVRSSGDIPRKRGVRQIQRTRFPTSISSAVIVGI
jgi:hypothetical protein